MERHRQLWLWLERETPILSSELTVLHLAPEPGIAARLRSSPRLTYTSGDLAKSRGELELDVTSLPFADDSFDVIICSHVLQEVPDDTRAIAELYRVLQPGGWSVLQVPLDLRLGASLEDPTLTTPEERRAAFGQEHYVRVYGVDFLDRLRDGGFEAGQVAYASMLSPAERALHAIRADEVPILVATKSPRAPLVSPGSGHETGVQTQETLH
jgi:SAM-dependent methyltransferase